MTIAGIATSVPDVSTLTTAVVTAGLVSPLDDRNAKFTVFAPVNLAFTKALPVVNNSAAPIPCVINYQVTRACASPAELLAAKNLKTLLLNHVVAGEFKSSDLKDGMTLEFLGGATGLVSIVNGTVRISGARVAAVDVMASNGVVHLMADVITADASFNTTSIGLYLKNFADMAPGAVSDLAFPAAGTTANLTRMVTDNRDLLNWYRTYRPYVAPVDGGWTYPMPATFDPTLGKKGSMCTDEDLAGSWAHPAPPEGLALPASEEDIAFMSVYELAGLIKSKKISAVDLAKLYIRRLKKYDDLLQATVTITEDLAMQEAAAADALLANGTYVGLLHGIPYGLKDLISVAGYRTTWGSGAFIDQVLPESAMAYKKLKAAGAVLVAKLVTGEMATGTQWWGGNTRTPWNIGAGASGSSAGPGAATAAGLVAFSVGSETGGSIVGPLNTNALSGIRPTHGLISRSYCMALSQTLDKLGPLCRSAMDAALVFDVIRGKDKDDMDACDMPLPDPFKVDVAKLKIGYDNATTPAAVVAILRSMGLSPVPINVRFAIGNAAMSPIYEVIRGSETAAYFDNWLRSGKAANNTAQDAWPLRLKRSRMIPAVEYVQASRMRGILAAEYLKATASVDVFVGGAGSFTTVGNLVNFPQMSIPYNFTTPVEPGAYPAWNSATSPRRLPMMIGIYGAPYKDAEIMALGMAIQKVVTAHKLRPPIDAVEPELLAASKACDVAVVGGGARCTIKSAYMLAKLNETGQGLPPVTFKAY